MFVETYPPDDIILSNAFRFTDKSLITGKDSALKGSKIISSSLLKALI